MELPMTPQPVLHHRRPLVFCPIDIEDKTLYFWVACPQQSQQIHELFAIDIVPGQPNVQVFVIVGAISPKDVQTLPATSHPRQKTLPDQQLTAIDEIQSPNRMTGIHEVEAGALSVGPMGGAPLPPVF